MQKLTQFNRKDYSYLAYSARDLYSLEWADHCVGGTTTNCRLFVGCFVEAMDRVCADVADCCIGDDGGTRTAASLDCGQNIFEEWDRCRICPIDDVLLKANLPSALKQAWLFARKTLAGVSVSGGRPLRSVGLN